MLILFVALFDVFGDVFGDVFLLENDVWDRFDRYCDLKFFPFKDEFFEKFLLRFPSNLEPEFCIFQHVRLDPNDAFKCVSDRIPYFSASLDNKQTNSAAKFFWCDAPIKS